MIYSLSNSTGHLAPVLLCLAADPAIRAGTCTVREDETVITIDEINRTYDRVKGHTGLTVDKNGWKLIK